MTQHPSGLSRIERGRRRRQAIITEAVEAFSARGFHAVSMSEIAGAVGVTKPALYLHFSSKEELYAAAITAVGQGLAETIRRTGTAHRAAASDSDGLLLELHAVLSAPTSHLEILAPARWVSEEASEAAGGVVTAVREALCEQILAARPGGGADAEALAVTISSLAAYERTLVPMTRGDDGESGERRERLIALASRWTSAWEGQLV